MKTLLVLVFFYSLFARLLRWLSIYQQKEYRLDRLKTFIQSSEGKHQLKILADLPIKPRQLRRPAPTPKAALILIPSVLLIISVPIENFLSLVFLYLLSPLFLLLASLPAQIVTWIAVKHYQTKAKKLVKQYQPKIIGITGSYGKTTTKQLLTHLLSGKHKVWTSPRSLNTPLSLPKVFAQTYKGQPIIIIEFAAYKQGEIAKLAKIFKPDQAIITGLTNQHVAIFGSFPKLINAKQELAKALSPKSPIFINNQDSNIATYIKPFTKTLDVIKPVGTIIKNPKINSDLCLEINYSKTSITTNLIGKTYLSNLELALACAQHLGVSATSLKTQIKTFTPTSNFINKITKPGQPTIIEDGKTSNPSGFNSALDLLASAKARRKIVVAGGIVDLGADSPKVHQQLAEKINQTADLFIHANSIGQKELAKTLGQKYLNITTKQGLLEALNDTNQQDIILIEGRIGPELQMALIKQS